MIALENTLSSEKSGIKLPRLGQKSPNSNLLLSYEELDQISNKVVKMKKNYYDPIGCSKSLRL